MSLAADTAGAIKGALLPDLTRLAREASLAAQALLEEARAAVHARVAPAGRVEAHLLEREQRAVHGLAWLAATIEAVRQTALYGERMSGEDRLGTLEGLLVQEALSVLIGQCTGGLAMNQSETARLHEMGLDEAALARFCVPATRRLMAEGSTPASRAAIAEAIAMEAEQGAATFGDCGLDETLDAMREEMRRFALGEVIPHAQAWHLADALVPLELIDKLGDLGVFGLTIPEAYGGLGLGKEAMCVVSEELSRGWIGVGSLPTRSEIAAELILTGGTAEQKDRWLPGLASGAVIPTAVFTEPDTGSDLASIKTRAVRDGDGYRITGAKTWITHGARADLMTLLARTGPPDSGWRGLSMFLAPKPRGSDDDPFPAPGLSGGEIPVLGYRGMREYEMSFDGFRVPADGLLGGEEGQGFKQLMATFEAARIQTAARAIGVAQAALDAALAYARARIQFGKPLIAFPRVADKLVAMAADILAGRQLTYAAARAKDEGRRCDLEAGMAKLITARTAWAAADNAVQIHGGNGFALEYTVSRLLCDARILSIFEGASEIQATVIARRVLEA